MKTYINLINIHKQYASNILLDNISLLIEEKSKIGLIGRNGSGKTTLLKILSGEDEPDSGQIVLHDELILGYLKQNNVFNEEENVIDYLVNHTEKESWFCAKIAYTFGIDHTKINRPIKELSSGFRMRMKLSEMLLHEPNFLLLDEPSNYLDLNTLISLENFLLEFNGGYLIVSHDREFLKSTCEKTIEIKPNQVTYYEGGIEEYFDYKEKVTLQITRYNKNIEREKAHLQKFVDRFKSKASKATQAQSKMKQIDKLKTIEIGHSARTINIRIPNVEEKNGFSMISQSLVIGYPEKTVAKSNRIEIARGSKVAILGENGEGKTTLLRTLAGEINPIDGTYQFSQGTKVGYFAEHIYKNMTSNDNVLGFIKRYSNNGMLEREILGLLGSFLFSSDDVYKPVSVLSGGEKSRLLLLATIIQKSDLLILDEPTNHLDFETVEALGDALSNYNGTILFTCHDRTFVSMLSDTIIEVKSGDINTYPSDYDAYVYHIKQQILNNIDIEESYLLKSNDNNSDSKASTNKNNPNDYHARKALKSNITKMKGIIKRAEVKMAEYDNERQALLKEFESITIEYDEKKHLRVAELKKLIDSEEEKWVEAQEKKLEYENIYIVNE